MKFCLTIIMVFVSMPSLADEPTSWSTGQRDAAIADCARGMAEPTYDGYLKRNNFSEPDPEKREKAIQRAMATGGPIWAMCACVIDEVAKRWDPGELNANRSDYELLQIELANGKCKREL
jgi:hypothetical protein